MTVLDTYYLLGNQLRENWLHGCHKRVNGPLFRLAQFGLFDPYLFYQCLAELVSLLTWLGKTLFSFRHSVHKRLDVEFTITAQ